MKTIETWFLWLMIYSIIGWVYESTICSIGHRKLINRGFLIYELLTPADIQRSIIDPAGADISAFEHVRHCLAVRKL